MVKEWLKRYLKISLDNSKFKKVRYGCKLQKLVYSWKILQYPMFLRSKTYSFSRRFVKSQRLGVSRLSIFYSETCGEFPFSFSVPHALSLSSIPNSQLTLKLDRGKCLRVYDLQISLEDRPVKGLEQVRVIAISLSNRVRVRAS